MRSSRQPMFGTSRPSGGERLRRGFRIVLGLVVVVALALGFGALSVWQLASSSIQRTTIAAIDQRAQTPVSAAVNVVITQPVDVDADTDAETAGGKAVVSLLHLDPERDEPVLLAFPDDLKVEVPGRGEQRISDVLGLGGPDLLVRVVEDYTSLEVDHFVEVSASGVAALIDRLGGLQVCDGTSDAAADQGTSCREVSGAQAQNLFAGQGDDDFFARTRAQEELAVALAAKARDHATFWNPMRFRSLVAGYGQAITMDSRMTLRDLLRWTGMLGGATEADLDVRVIPGYWSQQTQYVHAYPEETAALLQALQRGEPLPTAIGQVTVEDLSPSDVRVLVLNGEGTAGLASEVADKLTAGGFVVAGTDNHITFDVPRTIIQTTASDEPRARLLAELLPNAEVQVVPRLDFTNVHLILIIGADRAGIPAPAAPASPSPSDA